MTYYYIYKITCTAGSLKDHYYIGQHKTNDLNDGYKGSGVKIKKYYQKYPHDYKKEILCWCKDEEDMNLKEDFYVGDLYATDSMCLNLRRGGNQVGVSEETRAKMSESKQNISEETRKKISEAVKGENHPMYGKHHSEESRKKMSEYRKGKFLGEKNPMYGKSAWNKGKNNVYSQETIKKMSESMKGEKNPAYGRKWMNNGLQQKYVKPDEINLYIEKGYSFGRLNK